MKKIMYGMVLFGMMILTLVISMTMSGRTVRKNEIDKALDTAVEQTVAELQEGKAYTLENKNEFLADLVEGLLVKISSDSDIEVQIAGVDEAKGLLSVKVIEHFKHPNGNPGKAEAERTVVMEQYSLDKKNSVTITYRVGETDYKIYTLTEGSHIPIPANPENFVCWVDEEGRSVEIESLTADVDRVFIAQTTDN